MRRLVVALVLAVLPSASASQPTEPWEFDGSTVEGTGAVGEPIEVTVRIQANSDIQESIVLEGPAWLLVEGGSWDAHARAGDVIEHKWKVTPTQEGFWAAIARTTSVGVDVSCACALGFATGAPESIVGSAPEESVPVALIDRTLTAMPEAEGTVRLERAVIPVSSWLSFAEIRAWATPGSTYLCDECAARLPDPQHETRGRGSDTVLLVTTLPLADGEAYTLWDSVTVRFDGPPNATAPEVTRQTGCENRRWGTEESWSCDTPSEEWSHMVDRNPVPAAPWWIAFGAGAALAYRPPRGKRR